MDNALVLFKTNPEFREELKGILSGYKIIFNEGDDVSSIDADSAGNTSIIIGNPKADFLKKCPGLKWLQILNAGTNGYVNGEISDTVQFCCASGCYGHAVSEYMVGMSFMLIKKLYLYRDEQSRCSWQYRGKVKSIQDAVVLVLGLGDIGSNYARRMKALGSYVIGVRRTAQAKPGYIDELLISEQLEEALPRADIVAIVIPGTKDTIGSFSRSQFAKMKPDAVLINAGRGSVVDTEALCEALESGALGAAGLDVTDPEPLPPEHRLWKLENAVITPHISGGFNMPETKQYIMKHCLENARRFVRGDVMESLVDFKTCYRIPKA